MKNQVSIYIGEFHASREPAVITTILGPCVAVCLIDRVKKIGGMNHILMPGRADLKRFNNPARYGINAMELLINEMMKLGASRYNLSAKVFGGAHVLSAITEGNSAGLKNAEFIIDFLNNEKIRITNHNIGGYDSRRIYFHTDTGDVFLKRIKSPIDLKYSPIEDELLKEIRKKINRPGYITYFD